MFKGTERFGALTSFHQRGSTVTSSHGNLIPRGSGATGVPDSWAHRQ